MPWVRLDEGFARHPKVAAAGPLGAAMQVAGLCYCNQYLTDGFVPRHVVPNLLNLEGIAMNVWQGEMVGGGEDATWELVIERLVDAGLWVEVKGGYEIHDYLTYQPSKADVLAERKQKSEAGRLGGIKSGEARKARTSRNEAPAQAETKQTASTSSSESEAESKPVPVPVLKPSFLPTSTLDAEQEGRNKIEPRKKTEAEEVMERELGFHHHRRQPHRHRNPLLT